MNARKRKERTVSLTSEIDKLKYSERVPRKVREELKKYPNGSSLWEDEPAMEHRRAKTKVKKAEKALASKHLREFVAPSKEERDVWAEGFQELGKKRKRQKELEVWAEEREKRSRPPTSTETVAMEFSPEAEELVVCFENFPEPDGGLEPAHSLESRVEVWEELASLTTVSLIKTGCVPQFVQCPPKVRFENYDMDKTSLEAARNIVYDYVKTGVIREAIDGEAWAVAPIFVIQKSSGGYRLIVDLRAINTYVYSEKFTMEGIEAVRARSLNMKFASTVDIKSAFHHVKLAEEAKKFLGIRLEGQVYVFNMLPFGFATSPQAWNIVMAEVIKVIRRTGVVLSFYADDLIIFGETKEAAVKARAVVLAVCQNMGVKVNEDKSSKEPATQVEFIGFLVNLEDGKLQVLPKKVKLIRKKAYKLNKMATRSGKVQVREVMRFTGLIQSIAPACLPAALLTRTLYGAIAGKGPQQSVALSAEAKSDLGFWARFHEQYSCAPLWQKIVESQLNIDLGTDAAKMGWGAVWVIPGETEAETIQARGFWSRQERKMSISALETLAIWRAMQSLTASQAEKLRGAKLNILCDNTAAVRAIQKTAARAPEINRILKVMMPWLWRLEVRFEIAHIAGKDNTLPDELSRVVDEEDWMLMEKWFKRAQLQFRVKVTVDRFASDRNHLVARFNTRWACPGAEAVNAFTQFWQKEVNWANPPFSMIHRVLRHVRAQGAETLIVVPVWPQCEWYWELADMADDVVVLPEGEPLFVSGRSGSEEPAPPPKWRVLIAHIPPRPRMVVERPDSATAYETMARVARQTRKYGPSTRTH